MANTITLNKDYTNGQGVGASNYFDYAPDHDADNTIIEDAINQIATELNQIQGPNAAIALDMVSINDAATPGGVAANGVIGAHSLVASRASATTLQVTGGQAIAAGLRVGKSGTTVISTVGQGTGTDRVLNLTNTGVFSIQTAQGQVADSIDLWTFDVTADDPGNFARIAAVFSDGDDFRRARERVVLGSGGGFTDPIFANHSYERIADRIDDMERKMAARSTGMVGAANAGIGIGGDVNDAWARISNDGTVEDAGLFRAASQALGWARGGVEYLRLTTQIEAADGSESNPIYSFRNDLDSGARRVGSDNIALVTGGTDALDINSSQQRTSATQGRVKARSTGDTINSATLTAMPFAAADEDYDVGAYHSDTNNTRFTVPSGHDGNYSIKAEVDFDDAAETDATERRVELFLNGTTIIAAQEIGHVTGRQTVLEVVADIDLVATDYIELRAQQSSGTNLTSVDTRFSMRLED